MAQCAQIKSHSIPLHLQLRPRKTRTRTGCVTCVARKKRCDEQKPVCGACIRNLRVCSWRQDQTRSAPEAYESRRESSASQPISATEDKDEGGLSPKPQPSVHTLNYPHGEFSRYQQGSLGIPLQWNTSISSASTFKDSWSRILFESYIFKTAGGLAARRVMENPYLTVVLPRALSDELILHCVLALSAAHRAYEEASFDFKSLYSRHYVLALRQLRQELSKAGANAEENLRFLLATNLLATLEAVGGNTHGAALQHLHASRPFLSAALAASSKSAHRELISFLVESHAYMTLVANITFPSDGVMQDLLTDPLLSSLEQLRSEGTYGVMFGCAHGLFQLIPSICNLAKTRMQEIEHGVVSSDALAQYSYIEQQIRCWRVPSDLQVQDEWLDQLSTAAEIYRHALLIFTHAAFECSPTATEETVRKLQPEIDAVFPLAQKLFCYESLPPVTTTMLWPTIILGSCLCHSEDRKVLRNILLNFPLRMRIVKQAVSLLDLLWNDAADEKLFGPMGLHVVMVKNGINFCMA